jgi:hypothetical protein
VSQPGIAQPGIAQDDAAQSGMPQAGYQQGGYQQGGYQQGGYQQTPPPGQGGPGGPGTDQWYTPPVSAVPPTPRRKRPRWLLPAGGAAVVLIVIIALVFALGGGSTKTPTAGLSPTAGQTHGATQTSSPAASGTPLKLSQLQVGDCLAGSNMDLNENTPWPKLTDDVPCSTPHTAEVFYANNTYWAKSASFPGNSAIAAAASTECDNAFAAYDGTAYANSMYSWADIVPSATTWPSGDRGLHCVAYDKTAADPAGKPITGSIKGTGA